MEKNTKRADIQDFFVSYICSVFCRRVLKSHARLNPKNGNFLFFSFFHEGISPFQQRPTGLYKLFFSEGGQTVEVLFMTVAGLQRIELHLGENIGKATVGAAEQLAELFEIIAKDLPFFRIQNRHAVSNVKAKLSGF